MGKDIYCLDFIYDIGCAVCIGHDKFNIFAYLHQMLFYWLGYTVLRYFQDIYGCHIRVGLCRHTIGFRILSLYLGIGYKGRARFLDIIIGIHLIAYLTIIKQLRQNLINIRNKGLDFDNSCTLVSGFWAYIPHKAVLFIVAVGIIGIKAACNISQMLRHLYLYQNFSTLCTVSGKLCLCNTACYIYVGSYTVLNVSFAIGYGICVLNCFWAGDPCLYIQIYTRI